MAQLGARFHGMEEVKGSNPFRSTKLLKHLQPSVCHHLSCDRHCSLLRTLRYSRNRAGFHCFIYLGHNDYLLVAADKLWHTDSVTQFYRSPRALISLRVFLRLTAMDVCCGPPSRQ